MMRAATLHSARVHARCACCAVARLASRMRSNRARGSTATASAHGETVTLNIETDPTSAPRPTTRHCNATSTSAATAAGAVRTWSTAAAACARSTRSRCSRAATACSRSRAARRHRTHAAAGAAGRADRSARAGAARGDDVFIETEVDDHGSLRAAVGRLGRAPVLRGAAGVGPARPPAPEGASMQRVGDDAQYRREIGGRRYNVVERRFLLVPERSGALTHSRRAASRVAAPAASSTICSAADSGALRSRGAPRIAAACGRCRPNAPQPWLPLHDLQLRYAATPQQTARRRGGDAGRGGVADGATAAQMPELQLPAIDGVQVFAEPPAVRRKLHRRPAAGQADPHVLAGALARGQVAVCRACAWAGGMCAPGAASTATLPPLIVAGRAGGGGCAATAAAGCRRDRPTADAATDESLAAARHGCRSRAGCWRRLLFAALWLLTLVWGLQQRRRARWRRSAAPQSRPWHSRTDLDSCRSQARPRSTAISATSADALCAWPRPPARDLEEVRRAPGRCRAARCGASPAARALGRGRWRRRAAALREAFARAALARASNAIASPLPR